MRTFILVLMCVLLDIFYVNAQAINDNQRITDSLILELDVKEDQLGVEEFFLELSEVIKVQNKKGNPRNCDFNERAQKYFDLTPVSANEINAFRKAVSSLAFYLRKCGQSNIDNVNFLYKGHRPVSSEDTLDRYSWYIEYQIANMHSRFNDYDEAIYYYLKVIPGLIQRKDTTNLSRLYGDLGGAYTWRRELTKGLNYMNRGLELSSQPKAIAANHNKISRFYLEQRINLSKAQFHLNEYRKALLQLDKNKDSMFESRWVDYYIYVGNLYYQNNTLDSALQASITALNRINTKDKNPDYRIKAKLQLQIARIHYSRNDWESTSHYILQGLKTLNPNILSLPLQQNQYYPDNTFVDLLALASKLGFKRYTQKADPKLLEEALQHISLAQDIHKELEQELEVRASIVASKETTAKLSQIALDILYELEKQGISQIQTIRNILDRSKSNYLLTAQEQISRVASLNTQERLKINQLKDSVQHLVINPRTNTTDILEVNKKIFQFKKEIDQLLPPSDPIINVATAAPYFEFAQGQTHYYMYSNYPKASIYKLSPLNEIDSLANSLYNELIRPDKEKRVHEKSELLYEKLTLDQYSFAPLSAIIVDGPLQRIPFDVLRSDNSYLVHDHTFYYPPHIHFLNRESSTTASNTSDKMLILCPKYPDSITESTALEMGGRPDHLPYAEKELEKLSEMGIFDDTNIQRLLDKTELAQYLQSSSKLHFCGHATYKNDTAQLIISDDKGDLYTLTHYEIQDLNAQIDQLYLNACQTGLGKIEPGEGSASIARSFMESMGVKNVIYTLWNVRDDISASFATDIYSSSSDISEVDLSCLKRDYIRSAQPGKAHPYYWASIQQTQLNTTKYNSLWKTIFVILGLAIAFLLFRQFFRFYFS